MIEILKEKLAMLTELIEVCDDVDKIKAYQEQYDDTLKSLAKEEYKKEMKEKEEKEEKEANNVISHAKLQNQSIANKGIFQTVEVGTPDNYKGVNLKRVVAEMKSNQLPNGASFSKGVIDRMKSNPEGAEKVAKLFTDLYMMAVKYPTPVSKAAMQEGTDSEGGYLTPTEEKEEVLAYIRETSIAAQDATIVSMTSDVMTLPRELTKVSVAFTAEESEATESEPTLDQVTLTAKKMDAYSIVSNELIEDSTNPGGIIGLLTAQFIEAVANKHDSTVFLGTGDPMSSIYTAAVGYSEVFSSGSTHFSELLESNIRNIVGAVPVERQGNAKWYVGQSPLWTYVRGLKDSNGAYMYNDSQGGGPANAMLWGFPIRSKASNMPVTSAAETGYIAFGDLKGVWIGERLGNISLKVNPYTLMTKAQTIFVLYTRWAYALALPNNLGRIVTAAS